MKKASRSLGLALVLILFMSAVPAIQSRADYNPYSAWISVFDPAYYNATMRLPRLTRVVISTGSGSTLSMWEFLNVIRQVRSSMY